MAIAKRVERSADRSMLDECRTSFEKALTWIDKYGDFDNDGFVEYLTRSKNGLRNQDRLRLSLEKAGLIKINKP
jgi:glycogen debranching enzyme